MLPGTTPPTTTPLVTPSRAASWFEMPLNPSSGRSSCPFAISCGTTRFRVSTGMAKLTPALYPVWVLIDVFMPITRPAESSSGPPELPGLMAASVWIAPRIFRWSAESVMTSFLSPEMMPWVRVWSSPKGFPIASTDCPTCRFFEVPRGRGFMFRRGANTRSTAMS